MHENLEKLLQIYSFKNQLGETIIWTPSQKEIMAVIVDLGRDGKQFVQIETPTQFGKSSCVAAALVMRCSKQEPWAIIAGTAEKAQIIMDYFIDYCLDNHIPRELLKTEVALDKLKQDKSRRHLTFRSGFEIRVFSADSRNKQATGNAIMGFGAPNVILDEAALVDNVIESKVFRMISGFSTTKHLYLKIGNPFYRNHFLDSHNDPNFTLLHYDYHTALVEGRISEKQIEMSRKKPGFNVLYEVKFPDADAVDDKGWSNLLTDEDIEAVMVEGGQGFGFLKVGCDPSGEGTNFNSVVVRYRNYAKILFKERILDQFRFTERLVNWLKDIRLTESMMPLGFWVDRIGIGEGYYQTLRRDLENVWGINVGENAFDKENFVNLRAEAFWKLRNDIKTKKMQLEKNDDWFQLSKLKYRTLLEGKKGKIQIMSKEEMRANGIDSPDCFIAGTKILTSQGNKNIENLKEGEQVITPFGHRTIIKKWEVETDELFRIDFSNGSFLTGKGKHKILTKRGFVSLDTLLLTDIIETRGNLSSILWKIKKLLFIKEESIGLRKQADIFMPIFTTEMVKKEERKKHYIIRFGKILIIGKSLKDFVFITLTTITTIINQKILNLLRTVSTPPIISGNALMIRNIENLTLYALKSSVLLPFYGTAQKKDWNGIENTGKTLGKIESHLKANVLNVERQSVLTLNEGNFVGNRVCKKQNGKVNFITQIKEFVYFVKKSLWQIGIGIQNVVVVSVVSEIVSKTKVYNLTLDRDNVYYANGVLVENCADALMLTYTHPDPASTNEFSYQDKEVDTFDKFVLFNAID